MAEEQFVSFLIGKEEYAVSITQVREIIQYRGTTKLPKTPDYMEGIINLREKIIPVIDVAKRLGLPASRLEDRKALVIEAAGQEIGMVVDAVTEVIKIPDESIEAAPGMAGKGYIRGIGKIQQRLIILLDVDGLFSQAELREFDAVKAALR